MADDLRYRFIDLMAREFIDSTDAKVDGDFMRLATLPDFLTSLGLRVEKAWHLMANGRRRKLYHLPRQSPDAVARAVDKLLKHDAHLSHVIKMLAFKHPLPNGPLPALPGLSKAEWLEVRAKERAENPNKPPQRQVVLDILLEPKSTLTVRQFDDLHGDQRLSTYIDELRGLGHDIRTRMVPNGNGKGRHAEYRLLTAEEERVEYERDELRRKELQGRLAEDHVLRKQHVRQAKATPAPAWRTAHSSGAGNYGRHVAGPDNLSLRQRVGGSGSLFRPAGTPSPVARPQQPLGLQAPSASARAAPSALVMERIGGLAKRPVQRDESLPGVPVEALNRAFPGAKSRDVVEHEGARYLRQFRPLEKVGNDVKVWGAAWVRQ